MSPPTWTLEDEGYNCVMVWGSERPAELDAPIAVSEGEGTSGGIKWMNVMASVRTIDL